MLKRKPVFHTCFNAWVGLCACFASGIEAADLTSLLEQFEETQGGL